VAVLLALVLALQGCASPRQLLLRQAADTLAVQGDGDEEDLLLARDAAPFFLKLSESLLLQTPGHVGLAEAVARGFTQYAYAFVAFEADRLESTDSRTALGLRERAARLYGRAQRHALRALAQAQPSLQPWLAGEQPIPRIALEHVGLAYWGAASWSAMISLSKDRPDVVADLPQALALAQAAYRTDPTHGQGSLAALMGTLEAARPGGTRTRAQAYFEQALSTAGSRSAAIHVAMAESLALPHGDRQGFERSLRLAREAARAGTDLGSRVMDARAQWLLATIDDLF
jgi:hypothetical protein